MDRGHRRRGVLGTGHGHAERRHTASVRVASTPVQASQWRPATRSYAEYLWNDQTQNANNFVSGAGRPEAVKVARG